MCSTTSKKQILIGLLCALVLVVSGIGVFELVVPEKPDEIWFGNELLEEIERSARQGDNESAAKAYRYYMGPGKNYEKALEWLRLAKDNGNEHATDEEILLLEKFIEAQKVDKEEKGDEP